MGIKVWGRCGKVLGCEKVLREEWKRVLKCRGCGEVCWGVGGGVGKYRGEVWGVWESVLGCGGRCRKVLGRCRG